MFKCPMLPMLMSYKRHWHWLYILWTYFIIEIKIIKPYNLGSHVLFVSVTPKGCALYNLLSIFVNCIAETERVNTFQIEIVDVLPVADCKLRHGWNNSVIEGILFKGEFTLFLKIKNGLYFPIFKKPESIINWKCPSSA